MKIYPNDYVKIKKYEYGAPVGTKVKVTEVDGDEIKYRYKGYTLLAGRKNVELVKK